MGISINRWTEEIAISGIRQFFNLLADYPDAVGLTVGQPDFATPEAVKEAGMRAIQANQTGYSHNAGLMELRLAIQSFFKDIHGLTYSAANEIIATNGSSEGLDSIFRTILEEGDEVIIPAPAYPGYAPLIRLSGAKAVYLDTSDTDFQPDPERLEALITDKTKAVLMNFPSNPTGVTLDETTLQQLADVLNRHEVFIVSDEVYSENSFDDQHRSFARFAHLRDRMFIVHGLSKSHAMTGWRLGFVLGPAWVMQHVLKVHQYNATCASLPSQHAAIEALTTQRHVPATMNEAYIERRDFVYRKLTAMGLDVVLPTGAFYIFPSIKKFGLSSAEFAERLLKEGGVGAVPGSAFTEYGEGFLRISYAYSLPVLEEGMKRMEKFIQTVS
ncbi:aminotransferase class I/II-fold pyridoxal phosphate-dependent enzyme [Planococcus lenghuensis]|uniref:Aminotransferase n=1 Tax=Planococcus lenghuensis TaxID=2213202 RepID=A0A1Q2L0S3_9BACL|nr:aminotransferase class I/II-fold pyridoxal phosphate-dependent enzyme [Planococcus lenghuensis]AQQ53974.1 N-acetyl-L,L-diaminopimelate aminotransferase [Planococcus lenghuensis]